MHSHLISTIRTLFKQQEGFIPLHVPRFGGKEKEYVMETLESTMVSSVGAYVDRIEADLAAYTGVERATAVVNGTSALQVALRLVGVEPGTEVLTQALTFVATTNAIHLNHAEPVFLDVDRDTMGLSPIALRSFLSEFAERREEGCFNKKTGRRISACMPMHTFGFLCRIEEIVIVCREYGIPVVEDAAESLGSFSNGRSSGTFGDIGAFSFNGNKIISSGGGGALVSQNHEWMQMAKHLTTTAKVAHPWEYVHDDYGYNFRMPNINAALLCAQLERVDEMRDAKQKLFEEYHRALEGHYQLKPVPETTTVWNNWLISIELDNREERDAVLKETNAAGVMTRPIWQLMYRLPMYAHCQRDGQQNAEYLEERIVNIPSSSRL